MTLGSLIGRLEVIAMSTSVVELISAGVSFHICSRFLRHSVAYVERENTSCCGIYKVLSASSP